jgi:hypothetical protein
MPPNSLSAALTQLVIDESLARTEVIPRAYVTPDAIVDRKRQLSNTFQKNIQRIKADHPNRQYRVESHHFITDEFKAIVFVIVTREA